MSDVDSEETSGGQMKGLGIRLDTGAHVDMYMDENIYHLRFTSPTGNKTELVLSSDALSAVVRLKFVIDGWADAHA